MGVRQLALNCSVSGAIECTLPNFLNYITGLDNIQYPEAIMVYCTARIVILLKHFNSVKVYICYYLACDN